MNSIHQKMAGFAYRPVIGLFMASILVFLFILSGFVEVYSYLLPLFMGGITTGIIKYTWKRGFSFTLFPFALKKETSLNVLCSMFNNTQVSKEELDKIEKNVIKGGYTKNESLSESFTE